MNKQRYLAELRRLLVFMTDEDRERTIRRFGYMFDAAGPEGEAALMEELGSPTKAAIGLSRGYVMGSVPEPEPIEPEAPEPEPEPEPEKPAASDEPWTEIPEFDLSEIEEELAESAVPAPGEETPAPEEEVTVPAETPPSEEPREEVPGEEKAPAPEEPPAKAAPAPPVEPEEEETGEEDRPETRVERSMPLWLGIPLFILVMAALGLPVAAVILALSVVFLAPGCAILFGAWLVFVGGLWCTGFMADAILLFGVCAIVLAAGLIILFLGLWLDVKMIGGYCKGVKWLSGELLGRKVSAYE